MTDKERLDQIEDVMNDTNNSNRDCFGKILKIMGGYEK